MNDTLSSPATQPATTGERDLLLALSVCPLLAVSDTMSGAIGLGIAVLVALVVSLLLVAITARLLQDEWQIAALVVIVTAVTSGILMLVQAQFPMLYQVLGIFPLLLATNAVVNLRFSALNESPFAAALDGAKLGLQIAALLVILGIVRELVGRGSVFHDAGNQFGDWARSLQLFRADMGFLLAMLPPGAFISLGLLLAARNWFVSARQTRNDEQRQGR